MTQQLTRTEKGFAGSQKTKKRMWVSEMAEKSQ
jgi:hypothetical protein